MKPIETAVQTWNVDTDAQGSARVPIKASQAGQYRLSYKLTDSKSRTVEGAVVLTILGEGFDGSKFRFNDLELIADTPRIQARRAGAALDQHESRRQHGRALPAARQFGIYPKPQICICTARASCTRSTSARPTCRTFLSRRSPFPTAISLPKREIIVPPEKRVVNVAVEPSAHEYKPGAKSETRLKLTDLEGKPVRGSIVCLGLRQECRVHFRRVECAEHPRFFWDFRRYALPDDRFESRSAIGQPPQAGRDADDRNRRLRRSTCRSPGRGKKGRKAGGSRCGRAVGQDATAVRTARCHRPQSLAGATESHGIPARRGTVTS